MFWKVIIFLLISYLFIRFVTKVVFPIWGFAVSTRKRVSEIQRRMQEMEQSQQQKYNQQQNTTDGEYIDYEEIK